MMLLQFLSSSPYQPPRRKTGRTSSPLTGGKELQRGLPNPKSGRWIQWVRKKTGTRLSTFPPPDSYAIPKESWLCVLHSQADNILTVCVPSRNISGLWVTHSIHSCIGQRAFVIRGRSCSDIYPINKCSLSDIAPMEFSMSGWHQPNILVLLGRTTVRSSGSWVYSSKGWYLNLWWETRKPKKRKWGERGAVWLRLREQQLTYIPLPSMVMGNVQSLRNKLEVLQGNVHFLREYRDSYIMAFTESWLMI